MIQRPPPLPLAHQTVFNEDAPETAAKRPVAEHRHHGGVDFDKALIARSGPTTARMRSTFSAMKAWIQCLGGDFLDHETLLEKTTLSLSSSLRRVPQYSRAGDGVS